MESEKPTEQPVAAAEVPKEEVSKQKVLLAKMPDLQAPKIEQPKVNYFKTSGTEQPPELKAYLSEKLSNPYNKYCLDCKKNTTTHFILWLGIYLCGGCAKNHEAIFGGN